MGNGKSKEERNLESSLTSSFPPSTLSSAEQLFSSLSTPTLSSLSSLLSTPPPSPSLPPSAYPSLAPLAAALLAKPLPSHLSTSSTSSTSSTGDGRSSFSRLAFLANLSSLLGLAPDAPPQHKLLPPAHLDLPFLSSLVQEASSQPSQSQPPQTFLSTLISTTSPSSTPPPPVEAFLAGERSLGASLLSYLGVCLAHLVGERVGQVPIIPASLSAYAPSSPPVYGERLGRLEAPYSDALLFGLLTHLPARCCVEWDRVFSSDSDGFSFMHMTEAMVSVGPTLVLIRPGGDSPSTGVFGAYLADPWAPPGPDFYGSSSSFVFSTCNSAGALEVYPASGRNDHYMYLNSGTRTLENGLGIGGQSKFHGLWIPESFDYVESRSCSTFASPSLLPSSSSLSPEGDDDHPEPTAPIDLVEIYVVDVPGLRAALAEAAAIAEESGAGTSILNNHADARALLEMTGTRMHSDGLRDAPEARDDDPAY